MKNLSKRLLTIASFVKKGSFLADIGSDHCLLPIFLLENNVIVSAFAVENKEGPYKRMVKAIDESDFKDKIIPSLSDGIAKLDSRVDTLVIAGMGGNLIKDILMSNSDNLKNVKNVIIDAHTDMQEVYKALASLSFELKDSKFITDNGKPYEVMLWEKVKDPVFYTKKEMKYGFFNLKNHNEDWKNYYLKKIDKNHKIINELPKGNEKIQIIEDEIKEIEEVLKGF